MRDIRKTLKQYDKLLEKHRCQLYASDIYQVHDEAEETAKGIMPEMIYDCIAIALKYGAVVGYRSGMRDGRKERKAI